MKSLSFFPGNFKKYADYTMIEDSADKNKRNAVINKQDLWPDAIVPFAISDVFTSKSAHNKS